METNTVATLWMVVMAIFCVIGFVLLCNNGRLFKTMEHKLGYNFGYIFIASIFAAMMFFATIMGVSASRSAKKKCGCSICSTKYIPQPVKNKCECSICKSKYVSQPVKNKCECSICRTLNFN